MNKRCGGREAILESLAKNPRFFNEIVRETGYGAGAVGYDLKTLQKLRLISSAKKGRYVFYYLTYQGFTITEAKNIFKRTYPELMHARNQFLGTLEFMELFKRAKKSMNKSNAKKLLPNMDELPLTREMVGELEAYLKRWLKEYRRVQVEKKYKKYGRRLWEPDFEIPLEERKKRYGI